MSVLVLSTLLMVGTYLLSNANSESKISKVQFLATKNYYLAETGIHDMIWKIQNDAATRQAFLNGTLSSSNNITKTNIFGDAAASYQVTAANTTTSEAWIIATSTYQIGNNISQRVVKSYISKATGSTADWEFTVFAGGRGSQQNGNFNFTGSGVILTSTGGRLHANQLLKIKGGELKINNGGITASNNIIVNAGGKLTLNNSYQEAPTSTIDTLQIDFDSALPTSWKNRADTTYTSAQFSNLANNTTLNGIIYVTGAASITGKNMTINGVLVASGNLSITNAGNTFVINADPVKGGGLLSKGNISITTSGGSVTVNGLIYSGNKLSMTSAGTNFTINGSMSGFDADVTASGGSIILNYTPANFQPVIDPTYNSTSPIIQINHWEEQY